MIGEGQTPLGTENSHPVFDSWLIGSVSPNLRWPRLGLGRWARTETLVQEEARHASWRSLFAPRDPSILPV